MSDLIDRQKTVEILVSMMRDCFPEAEEELDAVVTTVREIPSAEPERKKGKWVYKPNEYDDSTYECSQCGEPWTLIDGTPEENNMKFCPNCGAKLDWSDDDRGNDSKY